MVSGEAVSVTAGDCNQSRNKAIVACGRDSSECEDEEIAEEEECDGNGEPAISVSMVSMLSFARKSSCSRCGSWSGSSDASSIRRNWRSNIAGVGADEYMAAIVGFSQQQAVIAPRVTIKTAVAAHAASKSGRAFSACWILQRL